MDEQTTSAIERELQKTEPPGAPAALRHAVLGAVHRQLAIASWERRLTRAAAALLVAGLGLNVAVGWRDIAASGNQRVAAARPQPILDIAATVAEATDAETGRQFARQLAALRGTPLSDRQLDAIQQKVPRVRSAATPGSGG